MAGTGNRKRNHRKVDNKHSLWGSLFQQEDDKNDFMRHPFFADNSEPEESEAASTGHGFRHLFPALWRRFNGWSMVAGALFIAFTFTLFIMLMRMWTPQDMSDIAGYRDNGRARDLEAMLLNAAGAPVTVTESEINRYLRDTCRMRQTGIFSIITSGQGVAVRVHDGYAEFILDRLLGSNFHQTTSVNLSFRQVNKLGRPVLEVDFKGGETLANGLARGGTIGSLAVPERHIKMLRPPLESLLGCYPHLVEILDKYHYCPYFSEGKNGEESRINLLPYQPT